ncbi:MAG: tetratricopeptide repeat protein, partial [Planctomycetes bacterium]|nr:tetratricopeptide repeat protein [Planctomycetota bacterium]
MQESTNTIDQLFEESVQCLHTGQTRKALALLFRVLSLDPGHGEALTACAKMMTLLNDVKGAETIKALSKDPGNPDLLYQTGYHLVSMGKPDVAKSFLEACLREVGPNPELHYELGYCHYRNGDYSRATHLLKKAIKDLDPERTVDAELLLIENLLYAGQVQEGQDLLDRGGEEYRAWEREDSIEALQLMYARHKGIDDPPPWDLRTWHFIRHGGVLLSQSKKEEPA